MACGEALSGEKIEKGKRGGTQMKRKDQKSSKSNGYYNRCPSSQHTVYGHGACDDCMHHAHQTVVCQCPNAVGAKAQLAACRIRYEGRDERLKEEKLASEREVQDEDGRGEDGQIHRQIIVSLRDVARQLTMATPIRRFQEEEKAKGTEHRGIWKKKRKKKKYFPSLMSCAGKREDFARRSVYT
ncbi:hypothetical protein NL676_002858 [Syzygium grande]|nr:hypothetical protein NL676_002858 [Syzygium grande]